MSDSDEPRPGEPGFAAAERVQDPISRPRSVDDGARQSSAQPDRHRVVQSSPTPYDAARPDSVERDSAKSDGAGPDAATPDGARPDGAKSDGPTPDGPPAQRARPLPVAGPDENRPENGTPLDPLEAEAPIVLSQPDVAPIAMTSPTAEAVTWPVRVASEWAARLLIVAVGGYLLLRIVERVSLVAFALVLGVFFTAVLHPLEARLRAALRKKSISTAIVLLSGIVVFGLVGWFVYDQISSHSTELGDQVNNVGIKVRDWLRTGPFHIQDTDFNKWTSNLSSVLKTHQTQVVSSAFSTARTLAEILGGTFLTLISTFFLMRDGDLVWRWVLRLFPQAARTRVDRAGDRGWSTLGGYVRGQVTIAFIHAITVFMVLIVLRVPLAAALAVIIFLGSFIPILGLTISGALCVGVTLLEHGLTAGIIVTVAIIALVQLEGNLFQPLIMSRAVHIHPLAVALSVAAGTTLDGIVGALIAVPLVAFINSFVRALREEPVDPVTEEVG